MKLLIFPVLVSSISRVVAQDPELIWAKIQPSTNLSWTSCYESFQCSRFQVPLDWTHSSLNSTMEVAVLRLPSKLSPSDKKYRGPILYNPGGPGESGIDAILELGPTFQQIVGEEFDIMTFDPRGTGHTTPPLGAFLSTSEDFTFSIKLEDDPPFGSTPSALARQYARLKSFGQVAENRLADVAPYVSTPQVARDMLAITKAAGYPKLKYWGVSYGTVLGMTFATMYPDHVERLVIDGVVDADDYYAAEYRKNLQTTDKGLEMFAEFCAKAGPEKCALHASSGKAVLARIQKIFDDIKVTPVPVVVGNGSADYGIVDYGMVRRTVQDFLYQPFALPAQNFSLILAGLERGDGSLFWEAQIDPRDFLQCKSESSGAGDLNGFVSLGLGGLAISCSDGDQVHDTLEELNKWYEDNARESSFADVWPFRVWCAGWKIRPTEPFKGKVGANTSFPIMFIGNTGDPAAPLMNAKTMSKRFPRSSVLTVDSPGHTSHTTMSTCNTRAINAYFRDGTLPKAGAICQMDVDLFGNPVSSKLAHDRRDVGGLRAATQYLARNALTTRRRHL